MEIAKLVLEFLKVLIWPGLLLVMALLFKDQFAGLLQRTTTIDAMGINVELAEQQAQEAEEAIEAARPEGVPEQRDSTTVGRRPQSEEPGPADAALELILAIERDIDALPVTSAARSVRSRELFNSALSIVAGAFGYRSFTRETAKALSERTGQLGWINLYEAQARITDLTEREKVTPNVRETRRRLSMDGVRTIKALLAQTPRVAWTMESRRFPE